MITLSRNRSHDHPIPPARPPRRWAGRNSFRILLSDMAKCKSVRAIKNVHCAMCISVFQRDAASVENLTDRRQILLTLRRNTAERTISGAMKGMTALRSHEAINIANNAECPLETGLSLFPSNSFSRLRVHSTAHSHSAQSLEHQ